MSPLFKDSCSSTLARYTAVGLIAAMLAACGGGGGSPGTTTGAGAGSGTVTGGTASGTTPASQDPTLKLAVADGSGSAITTLSGGQSGTVKATVLSATGAPVAGAIVKFVVSDTTLAEFTPASGSALTDASGIAVITVKPASFTAAGAVSVTATSLIASRTATASTNIAVGAAPLTLGTLSFAAVPPGSLPAFSTLSLNIPVSSGGQPVSNVAGLTLSSLCAGDGKATLVPGSVSNGVQQATYTNNGCLRGNDVITASIGTSTQTIGVKVDAANIGTVQFVSSNLSGSSIVLKGSGGLGRSEAAQLTFRVVDQHNNGLAGVDVKFSATTTTGGLAVAPAVATTDASGNVMTMVSSGTIPTPVRVIAEASRNGVTISGLSDTLTISTGLPIQRSMSMSAELFNIEGAAYDGIESEITVAMADQYGNPVSDGTAVNFVSSGGAVASSAQGACTTLDGFCKVKFKSQAFRPASGRITVLAFAQGIEDFTDANGDGQYSCTNFRAPDGSVPAVYRPLVDTCVSGGEKFDGLPDAFLDAGQDGTYDPNGGDQPFPYNHAVYSAVPHAAWGINYIRRSMVITLSDSKAKLQRLVCTASGCRDWTAADGDPAVVAGLNGLSCSAQTLSFRLYDVNNNPMPALTTLSAVDADKLTPLSFAPDKVPSTNQVNGTIHSVIIKPDSACADGYFSIRVETPKKVQTQFRFTSK